MRPAEYYLKELLYDFDCVTIPGFGGFIMQSQPARINRIKNRITPPSRLPSFNSLLNHDDGLLISRMARAEQLSYRDAGYRVSEFAENCKSKLSSGESIALNGVGELTPGIAGGILFKPLNQPGFSNVAFGMEPLSLYPLTKPQEHIRVIQKPVDRKAEQFRNKKPASVKWTLAFSIPVIIFLLYGIIAPSSFQNAYINYSGIVTDFLKIKHPSPPTANYLSEVATVQEIIAEPAIDMNIEALTQAELIPEGKAAIEAIAEASPAVKYYIIGGCFENESNAGKFLSELIARGFAAEQAGANKRGQVRISYKSFSDKASALSYLDMIRNEENNSAWLLKY
jgi:nucleoid DNA-binding protein